MNEPRVTLFDGEFVRLKRTGHWEYAERRRGSRAVALLGITEAREIVLIEQFRPVVGRRVVELPAGLMGDLPGAEKEEPAEAARRELREETGYEAEEMEYLCEGPSSAGLVTEQILFYRARGVRKSGAATGDGSEKIEVHVVPLADLDAWLAGKRDEGREIDYKIYAALYFARKA